MVVDSDPSTEHHRDLAFAALADATRRDIVRRGLQGEHSVSSLARHYPMSFAAVQKHVAVLERAGLVCKRRRGREQLVRTDHAGLATASGALDELEALWRGRLERFGDLLTGTTDPSPTQERT